MCGTFSRTGRRDTSFGIDKIHARRGFSWVNPCTRSCAMPAGRAAVPVAEGVCLEHRADPTKSRGQYLPLLELAVQEDPQNDRNMHYLGREYMFHGDWDKCIATLLRHLGMPSARWADERSASMRFIARAYAAKGRAGGRRAPGICAPSRRRRTLREPYLDFARFLSEEGRSRGRRVAVRPGAGHRRAAQVLHLRGGRLGIPSPRPARPGLLSHGRAGLRAGGPGPGRARGGPGPVDRAPRGQPALLPHARERRGAGQTR